MFHRSGLEVVAGGPYFADVVPDQEPALWINHDFVAALRIEGEWLAYCDEVERFFHVRSRLPNYQPMQWPQV